MGFFDLFKSNSEPSREDILIVFNAYLRHRRGEFLTSNRITPAQRIVKDIVLDENHWAMSIAFEALEYLGEPKTWSELIFALSVLPTAGAGGHSTTIRYANRLFSKEYIDDSKSPMLPSMSPITKRTLMSYRREAAKAYEGERDFESALAWYKEAEKLGAHYDVFAVDIVRCFVRLGRFDDALKYLEGIKRKPIYTQPRIKNSCGDLEPNYITGIIDECVADVLSKKEKGYVYRPRKKKEPNPLSKKYTYCDE